MSRRYDLENVLDGISKKVTKENVTFSIYGESKSGAHDLYGNHDTGLDGLHMLRSLLPHSRSY